MVGMVYCSDGECENMHRDCCGQTGIDDHGKMRRAVVICNISRAEEILEITRLPCSSHHGKFLLFLPLPGGAGTQSPWRDQKQIGEAAEVQGSQGPSKAMQKPHPLG